MLPLTEYENLFWKYYFVRNIKQKVRKFIQFRLMCFRIFRNRRTYHLSRNEIHDNFMDQRCTANGNHRGAHNYVNC